MSLRLDSDQEWDMLLPGALLRDPARRGSSHLSQRSLPCTDRTHTHLITDEIFSLLWRVADVKRHRALCSLFCSPSHELRNEVEKSERKGSPPAGKRRR